MQSILWMVLGSGMRGIGEVTRCRGSFLWAALIVSLASACSEEQHDPVRLDSACEIAARKDVISMFERVGVDVIALEFRPHCEGMLEVRFLADAKELSCQRVPVRAKGTLRMHLAVRRMRSGLHKLDRFGASSGRTRVTDLPGADLPKNAEGVKLLHGTKKRDSYSDPDYWRWSVAMFAPESWWTGDSEIEVQAVTAWPAEVEEQLLVPHTRLPYGETLRASIFTLMPVGECALGAEWLVEREWFGPWVVAPVLIPPDEEVMLIKLGWATQSEPDNLRLWEWRVRFLAE